MTFNRETPPMHTYSDTARSGGITTWPRRAESWLDQRGRKAWIAAMVLGFIIFWPVGLALLAYMIWGKQMFAKSCGQRRHDDHDHHASRWGRHGGRVMQSSGNTAFDDYKTAALRRLEEEQEAFGAFLQRLRSSKDKSEFDTFMEDRARANQAADAAAADDVAKPADGTRPGEY